MTFAALPVYGEMAVLAEPNSIPLDPVEDGIVNFADFSVFSQVWLIADCNVPDWCQGMDLDRSGAADMNDLLIVADYWLAIADVNVPDANGLTLLQAQATIVGAGLAVGITTQQLSDTVPSGRVIRHIPPAGTRVLHGTPVDLIISLGPAAAIVPGLAGMTLSQAEAAITAAGLVIGTISEQFSAAVPAGSVISHDPPAGIEVPPGSAVNLVISKGPASVAVPDLSGMTQAQAQAAITAAGLVVGTISQQFSTTVPAGSVISQEPPAGEQVASGTAVNLVVSQGATLVPVPNVAGATQASAQSAVMASGLTIGTITQQYSTSVPAGSVVSQNPLAGTQVPVGTAVHLVISQGTAVTVPDVTGMTQAQAQAAIIAAGLTVGTVTQEPSAIIESGCIIRQSPVGGQPVALGTAVSLVRSTGPKFFYVSKAGSDLNNGSSPTSQGPGVGPFATIQKGLEVLASRDSGGDVLCIRGGTYYEECTNFGGINGSTTVAIKNYNGEQVYIDGGYPVTGWTQCEPNECGLSVNGVMPPDWMSYCTNVYKAKVDASKVYNLIDRPYYGVKLVCDSQLCHPCGVIDMPEAVFPDLENYGWDVSSGTSSSLTDNAHLIQPDGYWNGAYVWFIGLTDNVAYCRTINGFDAASHAITFDHCPAGVNSSKNYWIYNHPHLLNNEGEYYWTAYDPGDPNEPPDPNTPSDPNDPNTMNTASFVNTFYVSEDPNDPGDPYDPNGPDAYYTIYYYKKAGQTLSDLNTCMKVLSKSAGLRFSVSSRNLLIEGLNFRNCQTRGSHDSQGNVINGGPTGQCGFICCTNWCNTVSNITIRDCTFRNFYGNEGGAIAFGECESDITVENCQIADIGRGAGIRLYGGSDDKIERVTIRNCALEQVWGSNIRPYFADNVRITGNVITKFDGVHGNAVTIYGSCDNVLIAHNFIAGGTNALVMKDTNGMYVFGNVFLSSDDSGSMSIWDVDYRAVTGRLYILQNTILTVSSRPKALFFLDQTNPYLPTAQVIVKNNILDGFEYAADWNPVTIHDYNLYLEQSTHQAGLCPQCLPWVYGAHEIINFNGHTDEFTDYPNLDFTLKPASGAVCGGTDLGTLTEVMQAVFPGYDFTVDMEQTPWASPPSMGAFEYPAP